MPSRDPTQRLTDIRDNIVSIRQFIAGYTFERYITDQKTIYAVTRALEIISEASRRLPDDIKARHPDINWPAVAAVGNIYRHDYESVDDALVWHTLKQDLAPWKEQSTRSCASLYYRPSSRN